MTRHPTPRSQLFSPTHQLLSPSQDLHFDDIPGGIAAVGAVPAAGWFQIIALIGVHELTVAKQDYTKTPGEINTFLGFKPDDPVVFADKQLKERTPLATARRSGHRSARRSAATFAAPPPPLLTRPRTARHAVKNGRLAMLAVLGEMMAQQVSGMGTYEQLGAIANSLPAF